MAYVQVLTTGGTIANTPAGRLPLDQVIGRIRSSYPELDTSVLDGLKVDELLRVGSSALLPSHWLTIARAAARQANQPDVTGVVVTHGTFTAEETAYFLHLTVQTDKPIVVVCSQRRHTTIGNDGDRNLVDALRVARSPSAVGLGAMLVMGQRIHSARDVMKTSGLPDGFRSGDSGTLGVVDDDRITVYRSPLRRCTARSEFDIGTIEALPRVDIVATYPGADGAAIEGCVSAGARGLVVNGFSFTGQPHELQEPALRAAQEQGVAVVMTSRGGAGRVPTNDDVPFVTADDLTAQKARVLLSVALAYTSDHVELQRIFDEY